MRVKTFVGKDREREKRTEKEKHRQYSKGPAACRSCGDEVNQQGFCVRCTMVHAHYRDIDNQRFAEFQAGKR